MLISIKKLHALIIWWWRCNVMASEWRSGPKGSLHTLMIEIQHCHVLWSRHVWVEFATEAGDARSQSEGIFTTGSGLASCGGDAITRPLDIGHMSLIFKQLEDETEAPVHFFNFVPEVRNVVSGALVMDTQVIDGPGNGMSDFVKCSRQVLFRFAKGDDLLVLPFSFTKIDLLFFLVSSIHVKRKRVIVVFKDERGFSAIVIGRGA